MVRGQAALATKDATAPVSQVWLWLLRMLWLPCPTHGSAGDAKTCPHGLVALLRGVGSHGDGAGAEEGPQSSVQPCVC